MTCDGRDNESYRRRTHDDLKPRVIPKNGNIAKGWSGAQQEKVVVKGGRKDPCSSCSHTVGDELSAHFRFQTNQRPPNQAACRSLRRGCPCVCLSSVEQQCHAGGKVPQSRRMPPAFPQHRKLDLIARTHEQRERERASSPRNLDLQGRRSRAQKGSPSGVKIPAWRPAAPDFEVAECFWADLGSFPMTVSACSRSR
jgi:hypothetical protein